MEMNPVRNTSYKSGKYSFKTPLVDEKDEQITRSSNDAGNHFPATKHLTMLYYVLIMMCVISIVAGFFYIHEIKVQNASLSSRVSALTSLIDRKETEQGVVHAKEISLLQFWIMQTQERIESLTENGTIIARISDIESETHSLRSMLDEVNLTKHMSTIESGERISKLENSSMEFKELFFNFTIKSNTILENVKGSTQTLEKKLHDANSTNVIMQKNIQEEINTLRKDIKAVDKNVVMLNAEVVSINATVRDLVTSLGSTNMMNHESISALGERIEEKFEQVSNQVKLAKKDISILYYCTDDGVTFSENGCNSTIRNGFLSRNDNLYKT